MKSILLSGDLSSDNQLSTILCDTSIDLVTGKTIVERSTKDQFDLRNGVLRQLYESINTRWIVYCDERGHEMYYVKHVPTGVKNNLYQIILGKDEYSGVYEFKFKGYKINVGGMTSNGEECLRVKSRGNFELAQFQDSKKESGYTIDFITYKRLYGKDYKKFFANHLLNRGLLTSEEVELYFDKSEAQIRGLGKSLIKVNFSC